MNKGIIKDSKDIIKQRSNSTVFKQNDSKLPLISVKDNNPDVHKSFIKDTTSETMKKSVNDDMASALKSEKTNAETISSKKVYSSKSKNKFSRNPRQTSRENEYEQKDVSYFTSGNSKNGKASIDNRGIGNQDKPKLKQPKKNRTYSDSKMSVEKHCHGVTSRAVSGIKSTVNKSYIGVEGVAFQDENIRSVIATKNITKAILQSPKTAYRVAKTTVKAPYKTVKAGYKATKFTVKAAYMASQAIVKATITVISFIIANLPIILAALAVAVVVLSLVSIITSIFANITLKSDDVELTKAYSYMTKLDSELTAEIVNLQSTYGDKIQIYVNGTVCDINDFQVKTDVDVVLAWFDAEYEDYAFDAFIYGLFGGTNIKEEIELIWQDLYSYETAINYDENIRKNILQVNVHTKTFESFAKQNAPKNKQSFEFMKETGIFTSKIELLKPFKFDSILNRYGYYCRPVTTKVFGKESTSLWIYEHSGVDIKADEGATVKAGINGTVTSVDFDDQYGNYVVIENKTDKPKSIKYCKLKEIKVKNNQKVKEGDVIGYVGNTGTSCSEFGACLHVEYYKNGKSVVPSMYFK